MNLHDLPASHHLRRIPLANCWYRWSRGKDWRQVKPTFGIAGVTYNDLGPAWTETSVFCWDDPFVSNDQHEARLVVALDAPVGRGKD